MEKIEKKAVRKRNPTSTFKKRLVLEKVLDIGKNGGDVSIGKAMREVGYSAKYANNPQKLTATKEWKDLVAEYMPDSLLAQTHKDLLGAGEIQHYVFPATIKKVPVDNPDPNIDQSMIARKEDVDVISDEEIKNIVESVPGCKLIYIRYEQFMGGKVAYFQAPDSKSRKDALDMAYKLSGRYAPGKSISVNLSGDIPGHAQAEVQTIVQEFEQKLRDAITGAQESKQLPIPPDASE